MDIKPIGPSFVDELAAAKLLGLPIAWTPDGDVLYGEGLTDSQRAAIESVVAAHDPSKPSGVAVRTQRDALISSTDWIVMRHRDQVDAGHATTLSADEFKAMLEYRQSLRDLPEEPAFPAVALPQPVDLPSA